MLVFEGIIIVEFIALAISPSHGKIFQAIVEARTETAEFLMKGKRK